MTKYNYSINGEDMFVYVAIEVVTGTLLHTKPVCAINVESQFLLQFWRILFYGRISKVLTPGI